MEHSNTFLLYEEMRPKNVKSPANGLYTKWKFVSSEFFISKITGIDKHKRVDEKY